MAKKKSRSRALILVVVVIAVIAGLAYSLYSFYSSGAAERGIVVCDPDDPSDCVWQDHMHAMIIISVDGETQDLPIERGDLDKAHTHEERNVVHWHSQLPYDSEKGEVKDSSPFMLSNSLTDIGMELPEGGTLFVKKGKAWGLSTSYGDYVWSDNDIMYVAKDKRTPAQVLLYLQDSGISLPYLGAG